MKKRVVSYLLIVSLLALSSVQVLAEPNTSDTSAGSTTTTQTDPIPSTTTESGQISTTEPPASTTTAPEIDPNTTTTLPYRQTIATRLIILELNGKIAARVTDDTGKGVPGILVNLQLGTTTMPRVGTDTSGYARFNYPFPISGTYIYCYTESTLIGDILYTATAATVGSLSHGVTATAPPHGNSTISTTVRPTSYRTYISRSTTRRTTTANPVVTYIGAGTTGMEESYIALNFCFDSGILEAFDIKKEAFADNARLLLSQENYATMIGNGTGVLMLNAASSLTEVTDEHIAAALVDDPMLSRTDPGDISRVVLDLSLQYHDPIGTSSDIWNIDKGEYVIQLPIPKSMKSAQSIAISAVTAEGITAPVVANISKDGYLRFETSAPVGTIVLLGFSSGMLGALTNHAVRTSLIFLIAGLLCIGGAIAVFFLFVRRPKPPKKKEPDAAANKAAPTENPIDENDEDDFTVGDFNIFTIPQSEKPRHKNPADYDLPL